MNESYYKYMELSIVHFMAFPEVMGGQGPIVETLQEILFDTFFTAVEIGPINDSTVRQKAAKLLAQARLKVGFGAQPIVLTHKLNPNAPDKGERQRTMEMLREAVHQAADLGAERMALLSGPRPAEQDVEEQTAILIDFLHDLSTFAETQGLSGLTLETFDQDIDKKALIGPNREAARVARALRQEHPGFGLLVDLSHLPLQHESIEAGLEDVRGLLVHAHIGNCVLDKDHSAYGDQHPYFGVPGGENDVKEVTAFIEKLFDTGFLGHAERPFFGFEVKPQVGESSRAVIASTKRVFTEAWAHANLRLPELRNSV